MGSRDSEQQKSEMQRLRRARAALRNELGWTEGFPTDDGLAWINMRHISTPERFAFTRPFIAESFRAYTMLTRRHRDLLPQLVERPDLWERGMSILLGYVQALVHEGVPLPQSVVADLGLGSHTTSLALDLERDPARSSMVGELSWLRLTRPHTFRESLRQLHSASDSLLQQSDATQRHQLLAIADRVGHVPEYVEKLLLLGDIELPVNPVQDGQRYAKKLRERRNGTQTPALEPFALVSIHERTKVHLRQLLQLSLGASRATVGLCSALWATGDVRASMQAHRDLALQLELVDGLLFEADDSDYQRASVSQSNKPLRQRLRSTAERLEVLASELSSVITVTHFATMLRRLDGLEDEDLHGLTRLAETVPGKSGFDLVRFWSRAPAATMKGRRQLIGEQIDLLAQGHDAWIPFLASVDAHYHLEQHLLPLVPAHRSLILQAMSWSDRSVHFVDLRALVRAGFDSPDDLRIVVSSIPESVYLPDEKDARSLRDLCSGSPERFAKTCTYFSYFEREQISTKSGREMLAKLEHEWALDLDTVVSLEPNQDVRRVISRAARLAANGLGTPSPEVHDPVGSWISRYPEQFHGTLEEVQEMTGAGERIAETVLGKTFPDESKLQQQIDAIDRAIAAGGPDHLHERRANLAARLGQSTGAVSDRLVTRLHNQVHLSKIREFNSLLDTMLNDWLETAGYSGVPNKDSRKIAVAVSTLAEPFRTIALGIVVDRSHGCIANKFDRPENAAFLERASAAGLDMSLWRDGSLQRNLPGTDVWIDIERDPYEVLQMGRPFDTCLSPGEFNFWSAVVNAIDGNKAVLVGRDSNGKMVARCLIALNRRFELLTYHPYAHDSDWNFSDVVASVASDIASSLGTRVGSRGNVEPIVLNAWYDDGPTDLLADHGLLVEGSAFMTSLATVSVNDFETSLDAARPQPYQVIRLLRNAQVEKRRDLSRSLLGRLQVDEPQYDYQWATVVERALAIGMTDYARRATRKHLVPYLVRNPEELSEQGAMLLTVDPVLTLRVLRQTRSTGVRGDKDEKETFRLNLLADAHEKLGRRELAASLRARL